jgi:hypothetical protein
MHMYNARVSRNQGQLCCVLCCAVCCDVLCQDNACVSCNQGNLVTPGVGVGHAIQACSLSCRPNLIPQATPYTHLASGALQPPTRVLCQAVQVEAQVIIAGILLWPCSPHLGPQLCCTYER